MTVTQHNGISLSQVDTQSFGVPDENIALTRIKKNSSLPTFNPKRQTVLRQ
jgi:hypothetical protein